MNFLGIGGLEFLLIFAVAMFIVGPKRLAEGVRSGRRYYSEFRRYREELTSLVTEAIDAEELKKELEETKREAWDEAASKEISGIKEDLTMDQADLDIMGSVPVDEGKSRASAAKRGDGKIEGRRIPSIELPYEGGKQYPSPDEGAGQP